MDFDTLEATQAIYHDEFDDETDEDLSESQRKLVAHLVVQEQKGLENKEFPVYEGDNLIGRHESCQICIPSKSLSKEHACITVKHGCHLIFDKGSRNKTKRGKLFLSPDVRYELQDQNELLFADVKCTYTMVTKNERMAGSGSETEEEKTDSPKKTESSPCRDDKQSGAILCAQSDEEDYASDASSDILQPTQPHESATSKTAGLQKKGSQNEAGDIREGNFSSVMETPEFLKKPLDAGATLVLPESGSETDDEGLCGLPPETLVFHDDDDNTENESVILGAATQALETKGGLASDTQEYGSDEGDSILGSDVDMDAATQAIRPETSPKRKGRPSASKRTPPKTCGGKRKNTSGITVNTEIERTQAYDMDIDSDSSSTDTKHGSKGGSAKSKDSALTTMETQKMDAVEVDDSDEGPAVRKARSPKKKMMTMETQKIDDVVDVDSDDSNTTRKSESPKKVMLMETQKIEDATGYEGKGTQIKSPRSAKKSKIMAMETQMIDDVSDNNEEENEENQNLKTKSVSMKEIQTMDTATEDSADENEEEENEDDDFQLSGFFAMSTLACEVSDEESEEDGKEGKADVNFDDATQAVGETVALEDGEAEPAPKRSKATRKTAVTKGEDATAPVENATMPVDNSAGAGLKEEDSTMPVDATVHVGAGDATVPIKASDATVPISAGDATMPINTGDATMPINTGDATMPINTGDATMPINASDGTVPINESDATMPIDSRDDAPTVAVKETTEDATVPIGEETDATVPAEPKAEDATFPLEEETATVSVSHTVPVPDTVAIGDTVPVADTIPVQTTTTVRGRRAKKPPASTADTLPVTDAGSTQEFGDSGVGRDDATLPVSEERAVAGGTAVKATVGDTVPFVEDASLPVLLPQITRGSDVSDDESTPEMVPESQHDEESTSIIKLPERSPFKPALVDPTTRSRSPSPKRVAFTEPEEPSDTPPSESSSSRRGRRGAALTSPSPSAPKRGPARGTKQLPATDGGRAVSQGETTSNGTVASSKDEETPASKEDAGRPLDQKVQATEDKAKPNRRGVKAAASREEASASEPRRSGRARKAKRFADDSEEEKGEAKKDDKERDSETASSSNTLHTRKKTPHGKGDNRSDDTDSDAKQDGQKRSLREDTGTDKEPASSSDPSDRPAEGKPGTSSTTRSDEVVRGEEVHTGDEPKAEGEEPVGAEAREQPPDDSSVTKRKTGRAGRTPAAQKRASRTDTAEPAVKKVKQSSDTTSGHSDNKDDDSVDTVEAEEGTKRKEEPEEQTQAQSRRASRKSGRHGVDDDKVQDMEAEASGQGISRPRGRASLREGRSAETGTTTSVASRPSRTATASEENEDVSDHGTKGRRGSCAAKRSAKRSEEAAASDETQELPIISKKSGRSVVAEEPMDTEDTPEVTDVTQEENTLTARRGTAQAAKKSQKDPELKKEKVAGSNTPKTRPRGRHSHVTFVADANTDNLSDKEIHGSDNDSRRSRSTRGRSGVPKEADASTSRGVIEASGSSPKEPDAETDSSSRNKINKTQGENIGEEDEKTRQRSTVKRRGRHGQKAQSPETGDVADVELETPGSTNRRGHAKQKDQAAVEDETEKKEKTAESRTKAVRKARAAQSTEKDPPTPEVSTDSSSSRTKTDHNTEKAQEAEPVSTPDSVGKGRGQTRKSLRSEKEDSENSQSNTGGQDWTARRGRQRKTRGEKEDEPVAEPAVEGSCEPRATRRGRHTTDLAEAKHSQDAHPPPRKGRTSTKSDPDSKTAQNSQDETVPRPSRHVKRKQSKDSDDVSEDRQDVSEDTIPTRRGRQARKTDSAERDLPVDRSSRRSAQSHGQEAVASHAGKRGKDSQGAENVEPEPDSGTGSKPDKESKRGGKRKVKSSSGVADSEKSESGDGPALQKRGRKGKESTDDSVTPSKSSPAPAKRSRHSDQTGSETPAQSAEKSKPESMHSPSLRRTSLAVKPRVIFTGVIDEHGQKIVKELGGDLVQSVQECTHLITDKIRRTVKFLGGVARGMNIVTVNWLESCKSSGMFIDASRFAVQDTAAEKQYKFSLQSSLHRAAQSLMLKGYRIHVTKSVRPEPQQMKEILLCAGAEYLAAMPKKAGEKTVVISCDEDKNACQTALNAGIDVVSAEFILTGILRQEVDIDGFRLFGSPATSSRSRR